MEAHENPSKLTIHLGSCDVIMKLLSNSDYNTKAESETQTQLTKKAINDDEKDNYESDYKAENVNKYNVEEDGAAERYNKTMTVKNFVYE